MLILSSHGTDLPACPAIPNQPEGRGDRNQAVGDFKGHAQGDRIRPEPRPGYGIAHYAQGNQQQGQNQSPGMAVDEDCRREQTYR